MQLLEVIECILKLAPAKKERRQYYINFIILCVFGFMINLHFLDKSLLLKIKYAAPLGALISSLIVTFFHYNPEIYKSDESTNPMSQINNVTGNQTINNITGNQINNYGNLIERQIQEPIIPLEFEAVPFLFDYEKDANVEGIKWHPGYNRTDFYLSNSNKDIFANFDILITTNQSITSAVIKSSFNECKILPSVSNMEPIILGDGKGQSTSVEHWGAQSTYRLYCEKFLAETSMQIILITVQPTDEPYIYEGEPCFFNSMRATLKWINLKGKYFFNNKEILINQTMPL